MTVCFWELSGKSVRQGISRCSDRFESVDFRIVGQSRSLGPALTDLHRVAFSKVVQRMPFSQLLTDYRENFSPGQAGEKDSNSLHQWEAPVSGIKVGLAEQKRLCQTDFSESHTVAVGSGKHIQPFPTDFSENHKNGGTNPIDNAHKMRI